jgi:Protein of unknown function (DUF3313)
VPNSNPQRSMIRALTRGCAVPVALMYLTLASAQAPAQAPAPAPAPAPATAPAQWDGLEQRPSRAVDLLFARPGASLEGYKAVRLGPLQVSFDQNWNPTRTGTRTRLTAADFDRIRQALAQEFARVAASELARSGYAVVTRRGEDVLEVQPYVVNLFITAPSTQSPGRTRTYTANAGGMTLVADLRDSVTSTLLFRVVDRRNASSTGTLQLTTSVSNMGAAAQIIRRWAAALRSALDAANGKS